MNSLRWTLEDLRGLRAARWVRESTAGQVDRYGPAAQREQQDRAIDQWGLVDTGIIWQGAHSGRTVASTQAFAEMLAAAGRSYDVLLVGYVSRFARDLRTAVNARHEFHLRGAALLFCDERLLSSDENGWETWAREAVEAEGYSRRLARRISEGYAAKFRAGDQGGSPGLGFVRTPAPESRLAIDPGAMPRAVALFQRYATGSVSYRDLESETGLAADAIRAILANQLYNGWTARHRRSPHEVRTAAPWQSNPPVSDDLWARVQQVRSERRTGGGGQAKRVHMLAKRLWCICGRRIKADVASQPNRRPSIRRYRHPDPCAAWPQGSYVASTFEDAVASQIARSGLDNRLLIGLRALAGQQAMATRSTELRRRRLEHDLELRAKSLARRQLTAQAFLAENARIGAELDLLDRHPLTVPAAIDPDAAIAALRDLGSAWRDGGEEERQRVVRATFARITVAGDRIVEEELTAEARRHGLALALPETVALARPAGIEPAT